MKFYIYETASDDSGDGRERVVFTSRRELIKYHRSVMREHRDAVKSYDPDEQWARCIEDPNPSISLYDVPSSPNRYEIAHLLKLNACNGAIHESVPGVSRVISLGRWYGDDAVNEFIKLRARA